MTPRTTVLLLVLALGCGDDPADSGTGSGSPSGTTELPTTDDTWDNFAADFMQTYCVSCHEESPKDFTLYADVVGQADAIRCGVAATEQDGCGTWPPPGQFPIGSGPMPSDAERDRLVRWIDAGLPE